MSGLSYGQKAVGLTFNPSDDPDAQRISEVYANIIDNLAIMRGMAKTDEQKRHFSVAITDAETAQMRAVKAITWKY